MALTNGKLTGNRCKCVVCGEVFSTESNFNKHRVGQYGVDRKCLNPERANLRIVSTSTGTIWKGEPKPEHLLKRTAL